MPEKLPVPDDSHQKELQEQLQILQEELERIQKETLTFKTLLRSQVGDLMVEAQELFVLYRQIKKAKKAKRVAQKRRGKNYQESRSVQTLLEKKNGIPSEEQKEKKRLYREAMLHVHPDKFYLSEKEMDIATEVTSRLIEIYQTGSLETLQAYHAHICMGKTPLVPKGAASKVMAFAEDNYLQLEKERLEKAIDLARKDHLYKVIKEYESPLTFVEELKDYYEDRIFKLKKRTRKGC